jgi:hypothetical protein
MEVMRIFKQVHVVWYKPLNGLKAMWGAPLPKKNKCKSLSAIWSLSTWHFFPNKNEKLIS